MLRDGALIERLDEEPTEPLRGVNVLRGVVDCTLERELPKLLPLGRVTVVRVLLSRVLLLPMLREPPLPNDLLPP